MRQITSCHHCEDRYPACHDHCERYQSQKAEQDAILEKVYIEKNTEHLLCDMVLRGREIARKKHG